MKRNKSIWEYPVRLVRNESKICFRCLINIVFDEKKNSQIDYIIHKGQKYVDRNTKAGDVHWDCLTCEEKELSLFSRKLNEVKK
jgi:hypothetical protein